MANREASLVSEFAALTQIVGGGLIAESYLSSLFVTRMPLSDLQVISAVLFAISSMAAGILLRRGSVSGTWWSIFVQLAQVFAFAGSIQYVASAGMGLRLGRTCDGMYLQWVVGGEYLLANWPGNGTIESIGRVLAFNFGTRGRPGSACDIAYSINLLSLFLAWRLASHALRARSVPDEPTSISVEQ